MHIIINRGEVPIGTPHQDHNVLVHRLQLNQNLHHSSHPPIVSPHAHHLFLEYAVHLWPYVTKISKLYSHKKAPAIVAIYR